LAIPLRDNAPSYDVPWVNLTLIGACIVTFLLQLIHPGGLAGSREMWGEVPVRILNGEPVPGTSISAWVTLFTSMWMHADIWHLLGNVCGLWLFGDNIEWVLGRLRYFVFYLGCGLAASLVTTLLGYQSSEAGLGASGAIAGVMCAYLLVYPRAKITSICWFDPYSLGHAMSGRWGFQLRNISAFWFVGSWIIFQFVWSAFAMYGGHWLNLGIYAHASGALAGGLLVFPMALKSRRPSADHHTRNAPLTMAVVGDEGSAGGDFEPAPTLGQEITMLREKHGDSRYKLPKVPFTDYRADELIEAGKLGEAKRHCREMLGVARETTDLHRELGYERMLRDINEQIRLKQLEQFPADKVENESYEQRVARVKRMLRGNRDADDPPDWL